VVAAAINAGVAAAIVGRAGGDRIVADGAFAIGLADADAAWRNAIPDILGTLPVPPD
jgi:hypothetical protein